ncbi:MAG: hypothetical protein H0V19_09210, partial [Euzebyales bacterium]|nr:hypothetical protein [Euzebyales bacterium]MBA3622457.1 hypothetical protein [Euzebyales bacterium]
MRGPDWSAIEARGGEVVRPVAWKLAAAAAGLALGVLFGASLVALFTLDGVRPADAPWMVFWGTCTTLWAWLAFRNLRRLVRREPVLGYDAEGLHIEGVGTVEWDEIRAVRLEEVGRGRNAKVLLGVYLHDPGPVLARAGLRRRLEGRVEVSAGRAPLAVHHFKLPVELWVL